MGDNNENMQQVESKTTDLYNNVNELTRVDADKYKMDIELFNNRTIPDHTHELCGSMQPKSDIYLKLNVITPEEDEYGLFTISNNGLAWTPSDETRLNQFGHRKIDKIDLSPVSQNGGGTKLTVASLSKPADDKCLKIFKTCNLEDIKKYVNNHYSELSHILYKKIEDKWCHFLCFADKNYHIHRYTFPEENMCNKAKNDINKQEEDITTVYRINANHIARSDIDEELSNLKIQSRMMFCQKVEIRINRKLVTYNPLNEGDSDFFSKDWGHPYGQGSIKYYEGKDEKGKKMFYFHFKDMVTSNTENLIRNSPLNKEGLISQYKPLPVADLQSTILSQNLFVDMKDKKIDESNLGKLLYEVKYKHQNPETKRLNITENEKHRRNYYDPNTCKAPLCINLRGIQRLNYEEEDVKSTPSWLIVKDPIISKSKKKKNLPPQMKSKKIMRTGGGYGCKDLTIGKFTYDDHQNIQMEFYDEVYYEEGDVSIFTIPVHKNSTTTTKRGSTTNSIATAITQIPHFIRILTMDHLWSKSIKADIIKKGSARLFEFWQKWKKERSEKRKEKILRSIAEFYVKKAKEEAEKAKEEAEKAKAEAEAEKAKAEAEKAKAETEKAKAEKAEAELEVKEKENKVLEKVVETTTAQLDNSQQKNNHLQSENEKLKEEAQLREKETVPWKMREIVYIRDNNNNFHGKCPCCKRKLYPFKPNNIHAGHVIPENFITKHPKLSNEEKNKIKQALINENNIIMICNSCNSAHKCDMRDYMKNELEEYYDSFMESHSVQFEKLDKLMEEFNIKDYIDTCRKEMNN